MGTGNNKTKKNITDEGVNVRVDKDIKELVETHTKEVGGKIGKFYDLAAKERLERLKSLENGDRPV